MRAGKIQFNTPRFRATLALNENGAAEAAPLMVWSNGDQLRAGLFSAKYSWLSALSIACVVLLPARLCAAVWP